MSDHLPVLKVRLLEDSQQATERFPYHSDATQRQKQ